MLRDETSGTVDWTQKSYDITGTHTLMWEYEKESGDSNGSDGGWVDYLTGTGETSPSDRQTTESVYDPSGRSRLLTIDDGG
jgi:hypothetical protein